MAKITNFDKSTVRSLRDSLNMDIAKLGEKYGITLHIGNASFTDTAVTFKLEAAIEGASSMRQQKAENALGLYAEAYLPGVDLTKTFKHPNPEIKTFQIVGWNTKAREYPVIILGGDGKRYKIAIDRVQMYIKNSV